FSFKKDPTFAPLWIELPNLPLDFHHPALLESIGENLANKEGVQVGGLLNQDKSPLIATTNTFAALSILEDEEEPVREFDQITGCQEVPSSYVEVPFNPNVDSNLVSTTEKETNVHDRVQYPQQEGPKSPLITSQLP
ncbi:hypothetical protein FRX31_003311, partial [Thalictrum thalictroides]